jgi:hypothetical protein
MPQILRSADRDMREDTPLIVDHVSAAVADQPALMQQSAPQTLGRYVKVACSDGATRVMPSMIARSDKFPNPSTSWAGSGALLERLALIP